jgi:hypothetical protein
LQDSPPHIDSQERFRRLQDLLFKEDRDLAEHIRQEVNLLREELVSPEEIQERVQPFIEMKVEYLQENFPELFGPALADTIKKQIVEQQDEMIDALYPIIGRLIRKFLTKELERLQERIDKSLNETFSWEGWVRRVRGWFKGESSRDQVVREITKGEVVEVFIVDQDSGLLAGAWSRSEHADRDMVAGMLTAIKSFVESAFEAGQQDLEMIEYENYKITLHNFRTFYIAVIISGPVTAEFKSELSDLVMAFPEKHTVYTRDDLDDAAVIRNSNALKEHLNEYLEQDQ